ncbi:MAG: carboxypeptidase-like regulatory domain-containing protein, partial [Paludibacteraceae bacterium]|nr:carboxypeptidase-like regulatory domain-containing protein [Paludibacteraceae bacterium]
MYTYSGIVTDSTSAESVPYASVFVAGTTIGTTTDSEGRFS